MPHTFSDKSGTYSVDMMHAYVNIFKPKTTAVQVADHVRTLDLDGWGDGTPKNRYSANDVLANPGRYPEEVRRIEEADLKFPILVANGFIVDGVHRLAKAVQQGKPTLKAVVLDKALLKKFAVKTDKAREISEYIFLFYKRFGTK